MNKDLFKKKRAIIPIVISIIAGAAYALGFIDEQTLTFIISSQTG